MRQKSKKGSSGVGRRAKKPAAGTVRRTSQASRGATARRAAPVAKASGRKPEQGAVPGMTPKKTTQRQGFKTSEYIVYPAHGVGQIVAIEEQEVAGAKLELFVINFVKDKMTLRVPTAKVAAVGMRKLAEGSLVKRALETLKGRARIKRTMWSRRAQEYEAKINSGDIVAIAEVVRDLFRSEFSARAVLLGAAALRSRSRPAVARDRRGPARDRDRGGEGDRGGARQGSAPRSEAGRRSRSRRGSRRRGSGVSRPHIRLRKARSQDRAFCFCAVACPFAGKQASVACVRCGANRRRVRIVCPPGRKQK